MTANNKKVTKKSIVQLQNGNYVEHWNYSQGYFDYSETSDIEDAEQISKSNFNTFFKKFGAKYITVEVTITFKICN